MRIYAARIKNRRVELDWTQKDLSERANVHLSIIKAVETGRSTDKANLLRIAEVMELPAEEVFNENFRDTRVISVLNNKGGSGKTSVTGSLGFALSELGYRILLIDADAQRNLTSSFGQAKREKHFGHAVGNEADLLDGYIQPSGYENIDFVVADASMGTLDMVLFTKMHRENVVKQTLAPLLKKGIYDFVIIDTNPNLSLLNFNIVNASHYALIPVQMASFDVEGIGAVVAFIEGIQRFNSDLSILGIVINRYDKRTKSITEAAEEELRRVYGSLIFETTIRVDVKIQNAQWENKPVFLLGSSRIASEYRELAKEVLRRC